MSLAKEIGLIVDQAAKAPGMGRVRWAKKNGLSWEIFSKIIKGDDSTKLRKVTHALKAAGYELKITKRGAECVAKSE